GLPLAFLFSGGIVFLFFLSPSLRRREGNGSGQQAAYGYLENRFFHSVYWVNGCLERRFITSTPARAGKLFSRIVAGAANVARFRWHRGASLGRRYFSTGLPAFSQPRKPSGRSVSD